MDTNDQFPVISGAKWEFVNDWDCAAYDIGSLPVSSWDGSTAAINRRAVCAAKCLEAANCVAFNYFWTLPSGNGRCYWKHTVQKSTRLGKTCGSSKTNHQYYTLLEKDAVC